MSETLTAEERALLTDRLSVSERQVARKALRIIDQQASALGSTCGHSTAVDIARFIERREASR